MERRPWRSARCRLQYGTGLARSVGREKDMLGVGREHVEDWEWQLPGAHAQAQAGNRVAGMSALFGVSSPIESGSTWFAKGASVTR